MQVQTSSDSDRFKDLDAASYNSVVGEFDRFTECFTKPLASRIVGMARLKPADQVLDVGAGTGVVTFEAGRALGSRGIATGIDLSEPMLNQARSRAKRDSMSGVTRFLKMDAERLEFDDCSFDAVLSLFALLHFPDPQWALKEMFRVLKPGGRLVVGVGSGPPWLSIQGMLHRAGRSGDIWSLIRGRLLLAPSYLDVIVERVIPRGAEMEESLLASSHQNRSAHLPALVREAGFIRVRPSWKGYKEHVPSALDFWDLQRTYSSLARKRLGGASSEDYRRVQADFFEGCQRVLSRGGKLTYHHAAVFTSACRPV